MDALRSRAGPVAPWSNSCLNGVHRGHQCGWVDRSWAPLVSGATVEGVFAGAAALSTCSGLRSRGVWVRVETHTLLAGGTPYFMWQRCALAWRPARGVLSKMGWCMPDAVSARLLLGHLFSTCASALTDQPSRTHAHRRFCRVHDLRLRG